MLRDAPSSSRRSLLSPARRARVRDRARSALVAITIAGGGAVAWSAGCASGGDELGNDTTPATVGVTTVGATTSPSASSTTSTGASTSSSTDASSTIATSATGSGGQGGVGGASSTTTSSQA